MAESILKRSGNKCELCKSETNLSIYEILPEYKGSEDPTLMLCLSCEAQIDKKAELDRKGWSFLTETMWSEIPAIQVISWRMLNRLKDESWAMENLDMMYMDDDRLAWAKAAGDQENDGSVDLHKDANGQVLVSGDTVILTKSLDVKGSTLNAKLGTVVKNIRLVDGNTEQVEGKIEGQIIVILTKYVRKQNA